MANPDPWSYAAKTRKEHAEQVALFMWANMAMNFGIRAANDPLSYTLKGYAMSFGKGNIRSADDCLPQLKWLHAVHNQGHGDAIRGMQAKAEGVKAGVSDIFLPVPRTMWSNEKGGTDYLAAGFPIYTGLYIELKKKDAGKAHAEQLDFQTDMRAAGYKAEIIHGWELARDEILRYLGKL